ncbi:DUF4389 domain-containing protein [Microbulbifer sediminum]|uniref:DUF4389 domain-containing protein n=1 Tax=Microbulbifer sediminum TaxID=2904250 RepID=UPI001F250ABE|nr:DUF4389 domain-containing protein [Microbulbifer sediminum]
MDNEELKHNITSGNQWMRLLYMVLFAVLLEIAGFVMLAVVVLQFLFSILTGGPNDNLRRLGDQIASFVYQTLQFLVYNTEEKPFPFAEWPESDIEDLSGYESAEEVQGEVVSGEPQGKSMYDPIELGADDEGEEKKSEGKKPESKTSSGKSSSTKSSSSKKSGGSRSSSAKGNGGAAASKDTDKKTDAGSDKGDDDSDK